MDLRVAGLEEAARDCIVGIVWGSNSVVETIECEDGEACILEAAALRRIEYVVVGSILCMYVVKSHSIEPPERFNHAADAHQNLDTHCGRRCGKITASGQTAYETKNLSNSPSNAASALTREAIMPPERNGRVTDRVRGWTSRAGR